MEPIRQSFEVRYSYTVYPTEGLFQPDNGLLREVLAPSGTATARKLLCVVERSVAESHPALLDEIAAYAEAHADALCLAAPPLVLDGGEEAKSDPAQLARLHQAIHAAGLCRHSFVAAIGGGAFIDLVGYAAATAHRGVRLVRVPTTVLAQNDAAVGVKNSVNHFGKKNFLGTFVPPYAVINDARFLTTLSDRDWRAGIAEAVKVALLKDPEFFEWLEAHAPRLVARDMASMRELIHRCAALHLAHIATGGDPFEMGSSRPLDFGHWAAHKLEQLTQHRLRHGEAVAIGLALDSTYATLAGLLSASALERILALLDDLGFTLYVPELRQRLDAPEDPESLFAGLREFQEHLGGPLTITLLSDIGQALDVHHMDYDHLRLSIASLETYHRTRKEMPHGRTTRPLPLDRRATG